MSVTTYACKTSGCTFDEETHAAGSWCRGIPGVPHAEGYTHQHVPKRSQGGKAIRSLLCAYCHDRCDNGDWGNTFIDGEYRLYDLQNKTLIRRRLIDIEPRDTTLYGVLYAGEIRDGTMPNHAFDGDGHCKLCGADAEGGWDTPCVDTSLVEWGEALKETAYQRAGVTLKLALMLAYGLDRFGEEAWQAIHEAKLAEATVNNALAVVRGFPVEVLNHHVGIIEWSALREIAPVYRRDAEAGERLLLEAERESLTVVELRARIRPPVTVEYDQCPTCGQRVRVKDEHLAPVLEAGS